MKLHYTAKTDVGLKRKVNEDCVYVNENIGLCAVADGMGGHSAGDVASRMVIDIVEESFSDFVPTDDESVKEALNETIQLANYAIKTSASQNPEQRGMGSTITLLYFHDGKYYIAQVGDSRAYLLRENQIHQITEDHSLVQQELEKGLITEEEAEAHVFKNIITRAVGIKDEVEVDFYSDRIIEGDLMLLCTDGLTNKVSNLDLLKEITDSDSLATAADRLVDLANDRDGSDNISVVLVGVGAHPWKDDLMDIETSSKKKLLVPLIAVVILALLASGYYFLYRPWQAEKGLQTAQLQPSDLSQSGQEQSSGTQSTPQTEPTRPSPFDHDQTMPGDETISNDDTLTDESLTVPDQADDTAALESEPVNQHTSKFDALTNKDAQLLPTRVPTPMPTPVPTRTPGTEPTRKPTMTAFTETQPLTGSFGSQMGDRYREGLQIFNDNQADEASRIWNRMLYETSATHTLQLEVDTLEKSVHSSFEKYSQYNLFFLKKKGRYYVYAGLFSSYGKASQAISLLPDEIRQRGPLIKQISQIRMGR
ncbi:Stp1/IreP family PP2C-type Ser/Thr phosphatase [bacterium]|nr:Stp1/IreP family PP2C-type Ser/Thr phosphatase [bacterium]